MKQPKSYGPRILVVDDEQAILDEFHEILCPTADCAEPECKLEDLGAKLFGETSRSSAVASFDLVLCHQGDEAVEKVRVASQEDKPFAVVFLDVRMPPGPDGVWTAEHIRAQDPYVEIVIVTAYSDVDPLDISRRVPPADKFLYVQKPFHPHEIRQFASALWRKWLTERQLQEKVAELARSNKQLRHEIEEHKRTEEKRQLLSGAIMSTDDSVYITDMYSKIIFVNRAFCETYGYKEKEIIGKTSNILWMTKPQSESMRSVFQTRAVGSTGEIGFYHKRKDDTIFPVSLSRSIIKDSNGNEVAVVRVARDISERIHMEDELRAENLKLKEQNQLKGQMISDASEELRTPLAALKDIISEAKAGVLGKISPKLKGNLESAEDNIDMAVRIIVGLCEASKIDSDKMEV